LGDPAHRAVYSAFAEEDPHVVNLAFLAVTLMYLGYIDSGHARMTRQYPRPAGSIMPHACLGVELDV
jgi:hypothetical protein